jgi:hypothetical protein
MADVELGCEPYGWTLFMPHFSSDMKTMKELDNDRYSTIWNSDCLKLLFTHFH